MQAKRHIFLFNKIIRDFLSILVYSGTLFSQVCRLRTCSFYLGLALASLASVLRHIRIGYWYAMRYSLYSIFAHYFV